MNGGQLAALIAAAFFAIAMCAAVYVLVRLAKLISAATSLVTSYQAGADDLLARSRAAVERADQQLARTGAMADGVDAVAASMSDLSVQVSAVAGTAKLIASGLGTPVLRLAAAGHGVRHALALRRPGHPAGIRVHDGGAQVMALAEREHGGEREGQQRLIPAVRAQQRRETWRERTERVRAARDEARGQQPARRARGEQPAGTARGQQPAREGQR